jgi:hypothetical protein
MSKIKIETNDLIMSQGLALVKMFGAPRTKVQEQLVMDEEKNAGKDPEKDLMERKVVKNKVKLNIQLAEIVAIDPTNAFKLEVGDVVLVDYRRLREFDLFKNTFIIQVYEAMCKVNMLTVAEN